MPYSGDVRLEERVKKLEAQIFGAQLLHIDVEFYVYERGDDGAELVEKLPALQLLIDPADGTRKLRWDATDKALFDELAAESKHIFVPITCSRKQLAILQDDVARVIGIISGSRAGKTHCLGFWMFLQWCVHGGKGADFWWVAPDWEQTQIGVTKLVRGDGDTAPVFPPELVRYFPKDKNQSRQFIELVDGSFLHLKQAGARGDNLKGFAPRAIGVDEGAAIRHRENWTIMLNRLTTHDGRLLVASTPVAGHWLRADVVVRAQHSDAVAHYELSIFDNPWEKPAVIEELIQAMGGHDDPVVRREFYGEWIAEGNALWPCWNPVDHLAMGENVWHVADLVELGLLPEGYVDVTARLVADRWRGHRGAKVLCGQDFNVDPMSTAVARAFGRPNDPSTWGLFFVDEVLTKGTVQSHSAVLAQRYPRAPVAVDSSGALPGTHPSQGARGSSTNRLEMELAGFNAVACYQVDGVPRAPRQIDSINLMYRLFANTRIIVHERCKKICLALDTQTRRDDGTIDKKPGSAADKLSGPTDAARYLAWKCFYKELRNRHGASRERQAAQVALDSRTW